MLSETLKRLAKIKFLLNSFGFENDDFALKCVTLKYWRLMAVT